MIIRKIFLVQNWDTFYWIDISSDSKSFKQPVFKIVPHIHISLQANQIFIS